MKNKKGSILVFAIIMLSFILVAAFSMSSVSLIEKRSSGISVNSSTAFQNSDKGMEEFLQQLYKELDQNDTLNDVAGALSYTCYEPSGAPARIGDEGNEFIITAYTERPPLPTDTTEWDAVEAITNCNEPLANVARFRATGNHNNAARAVFLKLRDSLSRGLVAHWSFEDRAQNARLAVRYDEHNSLLALDSSKTNYTLTLCDIYNDDEVAVNVGDIDDDGIDDEHYIVSFTNCGYDDAAGMDPFKYDSNCGDSDETCSLDGSWRDGIVRESDDGGSSNHTEGLYFNGANYLTALTNSNECRNDNPVRCDITANFVSSEDADELDLEKDISISAWFMRDDNSAGIIQTIISKRENNEGYSLTIEGDELCFYLGNSTHDRELCKNFKTSYFDSDPKWSHVVATWRVDDGKMQLRVNGFESGNTEDFNHQIGEHDAPLVIGASTVGGSPGNHFKGIIDDVRVWNRRLTSREVEKLCNDGVGDTAPEIQCQEIGQDDDSTDSNNPIQ